MKQMEQKLYGFRSCPLKRRKPAELALDYYFCVSAHCIVI